tara:strand:+ start:5464 stop:6015 length:552 start_codon:yes stop_codon:yes gene_type:complete
MENKGYELSELLEILNKLAELDREISYAEIPPSLLMDFKTFNFGGTLSKNDKGEFCVPPGDYIAWYNKIIHKGFHVDIDLNQKKLNEIFPKAFFWDCKHENLKFSHWEDRSFVIQRVLSSGGDDVKYLELLEKHFSVEEIKYYANNSNSIRGNENIDAICKRYDMQPSQFPNYILNVNQYKHK